MLSDCAGREEMERKRTRQLQSHRRKKCWCNDDINKMGVKPRTAVTIEVDSKDLSRSHGIIGVVYDVKSPGSGLVICLSGLICITFKKVNNFIPADRYNVVTKADDDCILPSGLKKMQHKILCRPFSY